MIVSFKTKECTQQAHKVLAREHRLEYKNMSGDLPLVSGLLHLSINMLGILL